MSSNEELFRDFRQAVAELTLISHTSGVSHEGRTSRSTDDAIGGRRPPGGDVDRPRRPKPGASAADMNEYYDALESWKESYLRRTPAYFISEFDKCRTTARLIELTEEARRTIEAWKITPLPSGDEPEFGSSQWKRYVGASTRSIGDLARQFHVSRQYIIKIQRDYGTPESRAARAARNPHRKAA